MRVLGHSKMATHNDDKPPTASLVNPLYYPSYIDQIPSKKLQEYYTSDELLKLIKSLQVEVVSNIELCHDLWNDFAPQNTLFDTWEFRCAFYNAYKHAPHFIVLKNNEGPVAVLPLWYEKDENRYVLFGSVWQEENSFLVKEPLFTPLLLSVCPSPLYLNALTQETVKWSLDYMDFELDDPKYILDLTTLNSVDDFLGMFKKKRRYNWRRDWRIIEGKKPTIHIDRFSDFGSLVSLSKQRFKSKGEETDWEDERRVEAFAQVIELGKKKKSYEIRMISVEIDNKIAAVDLITMYKNCYYPLKCGYDVGQFPGIGNYVNLIEIKDALSLNMKKMDFLEIDYGWKSKWFDEIPLYKYEKDYKHPDEG